MFVIPFWNPKFSKLLNESNPFVWVLFTPLSLCVPQTTILSYLDRTNFCFHPNPLSNRTHVCMQRNSRVTQVTTRKHFIYKHSSIWNLKFSLSYRVPSFVWQNSFLPILKLISTKHANWNYKQDWFKILIFYCRIDLQVVENVLR